MNTKTIFFNSDGDAVREQQWIYSGLDKINTASRPHLITELSAPVPGMIPVKAAGVSIGSNVKSHGPSYISNHQYSTGVTTIGDSIVQPKNSHLEHDVLVNGPGSGYFLSDNIFSELLSNAQQTSSEFVNLWKNNVDHIFRSLTGRPYDDIQLPIDSETLRKHGGNLPKDWCFRQLNPNEVKKFIGENTLNGNKTYSHINLVGWGRGAISCHMLANIFKNDREFCNLPINILAIDPIIGNLNPEPDQVTLGNNVKEYVGLYARDERSSELPCIVPDTASNTLIHIYPIAGRHTTLVGNQSADGENKSGTFSEPADLVFYLARQCMIRWNQGTHYSSLGYKYAENFNINEILAKIKSEYDDYINMRNTTYFNRNQEIKGEREILLNGQLNNFRSAQGDRFTPSQGLAKGHIEDISYFKDIT